jgi:DNA-directed RNA polymerase beta subunit
MSSVLTGLDYKPTGIAGQPQGRRSIESLTNYSVLQGQQSVLGAGTHAPVPEIGPAPPPNPADHRDFVDPLQTRKLIYNRVLDQMTKIGKLANARHTLELVEPRYVDPDEIDLETQKKAILTGKSLHRRIRGTWRLTDNATGNTLDEREMTIANVPHLTPRGTFVLNGTEYTLSNQMRLRPGVFTRVKENGEIESHVNVMPGNGISHRYFLDPETGVFKINIGQAKLPLYPILKAIGVSDTALRKSWGDELLGANMQAPDGKSVTKLYQRLVRKANPDATQEEKAQTLAELFHKMRLDPEVTKRTLGNPHEFLTKDAILDTTKKLIRVSRQEEQPDDRDHLAFQTLHGPEDLMSERITKDKSFLRQLLWKASFKGNLSSIAPGVMTRQLHSTIMDTGLGQAAEEINPAELLDAQGRATRLGEGGIGSMEAVPDEARNVQPSHFAYIDPVRTPECHPADTLVFTDAGWARWDAVSTTTRFACLIDGRLEFRVAERLISEHYTGPMYGVKTSTFEYLVTPTHRLYTRPYEEHSAWRIETADHTHGRRRKFLCGGHLPLVGTYVEAFTLPPIEQLSNNTREFPQFRMRDWAELMGWYLSEGHFTYDETRPQYNIGISQCWRANSENCERIAALLTRMTLNWTYNRHMKCFIVSGKQLAAYFRQFGYCGDKWIPAELLTCQLDARQALMDGLLLGDGRKNAKTGKREQFCTTSFLLAVDFQRLAFSLGYSSNVVIERDNRKENYSDNFVVHLHKRNERVAIRGDYYIQDFADKVYCATVPGGLLYVRRGDGFGHWSGNSFKVGVDTRITHAARKGSDGRIYAPFTDAKNGRTVYKSPQEIADVAVSFPGELAKGKDWVAAMQGGTTKYVRRDSVAFEMPHFENAFSPLANMIPGKSALKGQRMAMGSRYLAQALPMLHREAPYLQSAMPGQHMTHSFEDEYGKHMGAVRADQEGVVKKVSDRGIVVQYADGSTKTHELYNHFPFSRKTFIHNEPVVQQGQRVGPNDLLAKSNYTDDHGTTALGLNARIAFLPYRGANYEDAAVISESMAKRMTSEHMYQHDQEWTDRHKRGMKSFVSLFPTEYEKQQLANMDEHGVVKPGTVLKFGDPLVLAAEERERTHSQIHRGRKPTFANKTLTWDHHSDGVVTDVAHTPKGVTVAVKAHVPMQVGDKLSNRYGGKGVVAEILPDERMPQDEEGNPYEIALNPLGMISRINPIQIHEMVLGKIAAKTGRPYKLEDFSKINDLTEFVKQEMQKHGVKDTESVTDPETGRKLQNILTGHQFILKLHHTSEAKGQGRGIGGYTAEEIPSKGGADGSKRIALLETNALLSHGATEFLRDAHLVRGQKNDNYWQAFMSGFRPPEPEIPHVYRKFVDSLRGGGVNVVRQGRQLHIMALTNKDVDTLAGDRLITNTDTVDWKEGLRPKKGGFFDPALTGGHGGNRWAAIQLHEPMPNPAFEEPIRRMLGLTQKKLEAVIAGQEPVGQFGSGPRALKAALDHIDLKKEIAQAETEVKGSKKGARDDAVRKLKFLKDAERIGIHPRDWVLDKVPVLPPIYRPVSVMAMTGNQQIADANYLYKELFDANDVLDQAKKAGLGDLSHERLTAYKAFKGVTGLGEPITPKNQERRVKGILQHVFGSSPKFGMVQRQLLGATVELVGRAVITPNPDLDMDQVGLPENKAWEVYKPFVIRRLVQHGMPRLEAARAFKDQSKIARDAMLQEMKERPVVISRAPVLHRYGIMGFWPTLVKGDVMQIPPITTKGFNADFDGDTMNYHVPATEEAKREVIEKLLPSRNLISASDFKVHYIPSMEYQGGLYHASTAKDEKARPHVFRNKQDMLRTYHEGRIGMHTPVEIVQH